MKKIILILLLVTLNSFSINIAVATNISYAIDDLVKKFNQQYPHIKVIVTLGSSGKLTTQIQNQAPYGIFLSANMRYPNILYKNGFTINKPIIYAQGSLVLFSTRKRDFSKGLNLLKNPKIKRIAIANPKTAPYGKASLDALKNAKIYKTIKSKLVYAQSLSQTLSYTIIATDIGLVAKSSLYSKKMKRYKKNINYKEINPLLYTPISQGIVLIKKEKEYRLFYDFILSHKAQKYLKVTVIL